MSLTSILVGVAVLLTLIPAACTKLAKVQVTTVPAVKEIFVRINAIRAGDVHRPAQRHDLGDRIGDAGRQRAGVVAVTIGQAEGSAVIRRKVKGVPARSISRRLYDDASRRVILKGTQ